MTRRGFLRGASRAAAAVALAPAALGLARCGPSRDAILAEAAGYDHHLVCTDVSGLREVDLKLRRDNQYVDRSPHELRYCFDCANFRRAQTEGACASCITVKGPINPLGWCRAWTERR